MTTQAKECAWCHASLPARRRRFCSDRCCRRGRKAERIIETADYASSVIRQIRKMGERASGDPADLALLGNIDGAARSALLIAVDGCRAKGYSDGEIGAALGITRQAVGQRFGRKRGLHAEPAKLDGAA